MLALKGATETLRTIDVIVTETSNVEYNKGAPETLEILNFMDRLGFKIFDITETHRKPLRSGEDSHAGGSGVLFQLDFLFVRKTSPLLKEVRSPQISRSLCRNLASSPSLCKHRAPQPAEFAFAVQTCLASLDDPVDFRVRCMCKPRSFSLDDASCLWCRQAEKYVFDWTSPGG